MNECNVHVFLAHYSDDLIICLRFLEFYNLYKFIIISQLFLMCSAS